MEERDFTEALSELAEYFRPRRSIGLRGVGFDGGHVVWDAAQIERVHLGLRQHAHRAALNRHELLRATFLRCGQETRQILELGFDTWSDGADLQTTALRLALMHDATICLQSLAIRTKAACDAYCRTFPGKIPTPGAIHAWFLSMTQPGSSRQRNESISAYVTRKLGAKRAAEKRLAGFRQAALRVLMRAVSEYETHRLVRIEAWRRANAAYEADIARRIHLRQEAKAHG